MMHWLVALLLLSRGAHGCIDVTVVVTTQQYASESTWRMDDQPLQGSSYSNRQTYRETVCLEDGEHTVWAFDSFGDGWHEGTIAVLGYVDAFTLNGRSTSRTFVVDSTTDVAYVRPTSVRLVASDGTELTGNSGLLQLRVNEGSWRYVFHSTFKDNGNGANVACRELGFAGGSVGASGQQHSSACYYKAVACDGTESHLEDCSRSSSSSCSSSGAVEVICTAACNPSNWSGYGGASCGTCSALVTVRDHGGTCGAYCAARSLACLDAWDSAECPGSSASGVGCSHDFSGADERAVAACACTNPYTLGSAGGNSCPSGFGHLVSAASCEAVALLLTAEQWPAGYMGAALGSGRPQGCFYSPGNGADTDADALVRFNVDAVGGDGEPGDRAVCVPCSSIPVAHGSCRECADSSACSESSCDDGFIGSLSGDCVELQCTDHELPSSYHSQTCASCLSGGSCSYPYWPPTPLCDTYSALKDRCCECGGGSMVFPKCLQIGGFGNPDVDGWYNKDETVQVGERPIFWDDDGHALYYCSRYRKWIIGVVANATEVPDNLDDICDDDDNAPHPVVAYTGGSHKGHLWRTDYWTYQTGEYGSAGQAMTASSHTSGIDVAIGSCTAELQGVFEVGGLALAAGLLPNAAEQAALGGAAAEALGARSVTVVSFEHLADDAGGGRRRQLGRAQRPGRAPRPRSSRRAVRWAARALEDATVRIGYVASFAGENAMALARQRTSGPDAAAVASTFAAALASTASFAGQELTATALPATTSTAVALCPRGHFCDDSGTNEQPCAAGTYQPLPGSTGACRECGAVDVYCPFDADGRDHVEAVSPGNCSTPAAAAAGLRTGQAACGVSVGAQGTDTRSAQVVEVVEGTAAAAPLRLGVNASCILPSTTRVTFTFTNTGTLAADVSQEQAASKAWMVVQAADKAFTLAPGEERVVNALIESGQFDPASDDGLARWPLLVQHAGQDGGTPLEVELQFTPKAPTDMIIFPERLELVQRAAYSNSSSMQMTLIIYNIGDDAWNLTPAVVAQVTSDMAEQAAAPSWVESIESSLPYGVDYRANPLVVPEGGGVVQLTIGVNISAMVPQLYTAAVELQTTKPEVQTVPVAITILPGYTDASQCVVDFPTAETQRARQADEERRVRASATLSLVVEARDEQGFENEGELYGDVFAFSATCVNVNGSRCEAAAVAQNDAAIVVSGVTAYDFVEEEHRAELSFPMVGIYRLNTTLLPTPEREGGLVDSALYEVLPVLCGPGASADEDGAACFCPDGYVGDPRVGSPNPCRPCEAGKYQPQTGKKTCLTCPLGSFCPVGALEPRECAAGFYCPEPSEQRLCDTSGSYCPALRLEVDAMVEGDCEAGSFCSNATYTQRCDAGSYCPARSSEQRSCRPGFHCPQPEQEAECPASTYAYCEERLQCTTCPPHSRPSVQRNRCVCDPGYFSIFDLEGEGELPPQLLVTVGDSDCELYNLLCVGGSAVVEGLANVTSHPTTSGVYVFADLEEYERYNPVVAHGEGSGGGARRLQLAAKATPDSSDAAVDVVDCATRALGANCTACVARAGSTCAAADGQGKCSGYGVCAAQAVLLTSSLRLKPGFWQRKHWFVRRLTSCLGGGSLSLAGGTGWMVDADADDCSGGGRRLQFVDVEGADGPAAQQGLEDLYSKLVHQCPGTGEMCLGGEEWTQCAVGYKADSPMCAVCDVGYIQASDWTCSPCPENTGWSFFGILVACVVVLVVVVVMWKRVAALVTTLYLKMHIYKDYLESVGVETDEQGFMTEGGKEKAHTLATRVSKRGQRLLTRMQSQEAEQAEQSAAAAAAGTLDDGADGGANAAAAQGAEAEEKPPPAAHERGVRQKLKIVVTMVQVSSALLGVIHIQWPPSFVKFMSSLAFINLSLPSMFTISCVNTGFSFRAWFLWCMFLPVMAIGAVAALCAYWGRAATQRAAAAAEEAAKTAAQDNSGGAVWWYSAHLKEHGPVSRQALLELKAADTITDATLVWREGMHGWLELSKVLALRRLPAAQTAADETAEQKSTAAAEKEAGETTDSFSANLNALATAALKGKKLREREERPPWKDSHDLFVKLTCIILFLAYPQVCTTICRMLEPCVVLLDGSSWHPSDYSLSCDTGAHTAYRVFAWFCLLLYVIGVPLFYYLLLKRKKKELYEEVAPHSDGAFFSQHNARWYAINGVIEDQLGFLYSAYEPAYWYWEVTEMMRKAFFTGVLVFVAPGTASQIVIAIVVGLVCLTRTAFNEPYISDTDDLADVLANLEIFCLLFAALLIKVDVTSTDNYNEDLWGGLIVAMIVIPALIALGLIGTEVLGPFFEEWRAEADRRRRIGMEPISFKKYLQQMLKRETTGTDEAAQHHCLTAGVESEFDAARKELEAFQHASLDVEVEVRQLVRWLARVDQQLCTLSRRLAKRAAEKEKPRLSVRGSVSQFGAQLGQRMQRARSFSGGAQSNASGGPRAAPAPPAIQLPSETCPPKIRVAHEAAVHALTLVVSDFCSHHSMPRHELAVQLQRAVAALAAAALAKGAWHSGDEAASHRLDPGVPGWARAELRLSQNVALAISKGHFAGKAQSGDAATEAKHSSQETLKLLKRTIAQLKVLKRKLSHVTLALITPEGDDAPQDKKEGPPTPSRAKTKAPPASSRAKKPPPRSNIAPLSESAPPPSEAATASVAAGEGGGAAPPAPPLPPSTAASPLPPPEVATGDAGSDGVDATPPPAAALGGDGNGGGDQAGSGSSVQVPVQPEQGGQPRPASGVAAFVTRV